MQLLPRQFTPRQQQQIINWEVGKRWRSLPAGVIFPASVTYPSPAMLAGGKLTANRIGIARQATCPAATDPDVAAVLTRSGCKAVLRATYVDATESYVVTVGVAALPGVSQAGAALRELGGPALSRVRGAGGVADGVRPVAFNGTPSAWFTDNHRQISAGAGAGTYLVFYTVGYADNRPRLPVASDRYTDSEMTSLGAGVAGAVIKTLAAPVRQPHCPGTPGC